MNDEQRKQLTDAADLIGRAQANIESVLSDVQGALDDLKNQDGPAGTKLSEQIDTLTEAHDKCDELTEALYGLRDA